MYHHHHHHGVARPSKSMVVSTTLRQAERSASRRRAVWRPKLSGLRSASTVHSQDWRGDLSGGANLWRDDWWKLSVRVHGLEPDLLKQYGQTA